jgi:hypothetical protein
LYGDEDSAAFLLHLKAANLFPEDQLAHRGLAEVFEQFLALDVFLEWVWDH